MRILRQGVILFFSIVSQLCEFCTETWRIEHDYFHRVLGGFLVHHIAIALLNKHLINANRKKAFLYICHNNH